MLDAAVAVHSSDPSVLESHPDPFGEGPLEYFEQPHPWNHEGAYRLSSQLNSRGKAVSLAVGVAAR